MATVAPAALPASSGTPSSPWSALVTRSGWLVAAALLIGMVVLFGQVADLRVRAGLFDPATRHAQLPQVAKDAVVLAWATEGLEGDVTWSDSLNEGYMRIDGLDVNDPSEMQYQLWIFRDPSLEPHPVDGGVFDVATAGEVIIPIDAKLEVGRASVFAITQEKPGGVVVSGRETISGIAARD